MAGGRPTALRDARLGPSLSAATALWMTASTFDLLAHGAAAPALLGEFSGGTGAALAEMAALGAVPVAELRAMNFPWPNDATDVYIGGEMRGLGLRPDGAPWAVAVEAPDPERRAPHAIVALEDAAVATLGDCRHWVEVRGRRLSHTMDPRRGALLPASPASVTVVAWSCAGADTWATALMVLESSAGADLARGHNLDALVMDRERDRLHETRVGDCSARLPTPGA